MAAERGTTGEYSASNSRERGPCATEPWGLPCEREALRNALALCERALRDQPMQAFRSEASRQRRAEAIDAAQVALR